MGQLSAVLGLLKKAFPNTSRHSWHSSQHSQHVRSGWDSLGSGVLGLGKALSVLKNVPVGVGSAEKGAGIAGSGWEMHLVIVLGVLGAVWKDVGYCRKTCWESWGWLRDVLGTVLIGLGKALRYLMGVGSVGKRVIALSGRVLGKGAGKVLKWLGNVLGVLWNVSIVRRMLDTFMGWECWECQQKRCWECWERCERLRVLGKVSGVLRKLVGKGVGRVGNVLGVSGRCRDC